MVLISEDRQDLLMDLMVEDEWRGVSGIEERER